MKSTATMKNNLSANSGSALRYGMFIPLALMMVYVNFVYNLPFGKPSKRVFEFKPN